MAGAAGTAHQPDRQWLTRETSPDAVDGVRPREPMHMPLTDLRRPTGPHENSDSLCPQKLSLMSGASCGKTAGHTHFAQRDFVCASVLESVTVWEMLNGGCSSMSLCRRVV